MKNKIQPKPEREKLIAEKSSVCILSSFTGRAGDIVATCNTSFGKDGSGLAKRIEKCCNNEWKIDVHDELVKELRQQIIELKNIGEDNFTNYEIRKYARLKELLKQAERE